MSRAYLSVPRHSAGLPPAPDNVLDMVAKGRGGFSCDGAGR